MPRELADKLRVRVLRRHITKGLKGMENGSVLIDCVVAQALKEKFPRTSVSVGLFTASVDGENYTVSGKGATLIRRACFEKAIKPTTITLTKIQ